MSFLSDLADARTAISRELHLATCEVRTFASDYAPNPSSRVACHYEALPPATGGALDYEAGNGYGYTVWFDGAVVTIDEKDTVVVVASPVARDVGMELQVQAIPPRSSNGPVDKVETVKR